MWWSFILQHADRIGAYTLLLLFVVCLATGRIVWGWQYDQQVARTKYFMELARRYATLARTSVEVAELLPEEAHSGQAELHRSGVPDDGEPTSRGLPPAEGQAGTSGENTGTRREDGAS